MDEAAMCRVAWKLSSLEAAWYLGMRSRKVECVVGVRWCRQAGKQAVQASKVGGGVDDRWWCCKQVCPGLAHVAWPWQRMQDEVWTR
jgi:hypothetical protein